MTVRLLSSGAYGRRVGLRVDRSDESALRAVLPFWWTDDDVQPERVWEVATDDAAEQLVRHMELWVAEHAVHRIFVHAAAVAVDGRALLLPGRSMSGKTTLAAALLRAGAQYASDEYAVLDDAGHVHPYPRPLSVRNGAGRSRVPAGEFGATVATSPVPVAAVAVVRYVPGASWEPAPLSRADTVLRLLDNTVSARSRPAAAVATLACAVSDATAVLGTRGEAETAVAGLLELLAAAGAPTTA